MTRDKINEASNMKISKHNLRIHLHRLSEHSSKPQASYKRGLTPSETEGIPVRPASLTPGLHLRPHAPENCPDCLCGGHVFALYCWLVPSARHDQHVTCDASVFFLANTPWRMVWGTRTLVVGGAVGRQGVGEGDVHGNMKEIGEMDLIGLTYVSRSVPPETSKCGASRSEEPDVVLRRVLILAP